VNKKVKRLARKSALAYKVKENSISVIEDFSFEEPKTKNYLEFLNNFEMVDAKTLVVIPKMITM
jgi:large subunit ribosomal protein L4